MPRAPWTVIERGDILRIVGAPDEVERASRRIGFVERDLSKTDLTFLAGGICAGILLGMLKLSAAGITLGLGTAGSILVLGLVGGWARSRYPVFGAIPEPAQHLLMDIGLIVFIAIVGLHAGPHAVEAYRVSGGAFFASLFVAGVIVTIVPLTVGAIVGRYVLKLSPLMLLGGLAGAQTCTPGLTALREASQQQRGCVGLHGAVRDRQHYPDDLGASGRRDSSTPCGNRPPRVSMSRMRAPSTRHPAHGTRHPAPAPSTQCSGTNFALQSPPASRSAREPGLADKIRRTTPICRRSADSSWRAAATLMFPEGVPGMTKTMSAWAVAGALAMLVPLSAGAQSTAPSATDKVTINGWALNMSNTATGANQTIRINIDRLVEPVAAPAPDHDVPREEAGRPAARAREAARARALQLPRLHGPRSRTTPCGSAPTSATR